MSIRHPKLMIYCDERQSRYLLRMDGDESPQSFNTLDEAIAGATLATHTEGRLTIYDQFGKVVMTTAIFPAGETH